MITQELLKELMDYDPITGTLIWRVRDRKWFDRDQAYKMWNARYPGRVIAYSRPTQGGKKYIKTSVFSKDYLAHRLIYMWMIGEWPTEIDHINGDGTDNRWCNLRNVTRIENGKNQRKFSNNKSGVSGVCWNLRCSKWEVTIGKKYLGVFSDLNEAVRVRKQAEIEHYYHENHGKRRAL